MRLRLILVFFFQTLVNAQQRECKAVENVFKSITDCVTSIASPKSSFRVSSQRPHSGRGQLVNYEDREYYHFLKNKKFLKNTSQQNIPNYWIPEVCLTTFYIFFND